jgi:hypothetical protein
VSLVPRLAAASVRRTLPGLGGAPGPGRRPIRARRHRGVGRVHPHPPLQLLDLSQQRRDHLIPLGQGSQQLLTAELPRIRHPPKLRITRHSSHDHQNRRVYLKSDTGNRPEWIPFTGFASFHGAAFGGEAAFSRAAFGGRADFSSSTFAEKAWFSQATFGYDVEFNDATFCRAATFYGTIFDGIVEFQPATFHGDATFHGRSSTAAPGSMG